MQINMVGVFEACQRPCARQSDLASGQPFVSKMINIFCGRVVPYLPSQLTLIGGAIVADDFEAADSILEASLRELSTAGAVREFHVFGLRGGGLGVAAICGMTGPGSTRVLAASRGGTRRFASLDTAAGFMRDMNVTDFHVDVTHYQPGRVRASRPDRSEAMKRTRTAPKQASLLA